MGINFDKKHKDIFWDNRNNLYLECGGSYTTVPINKHQFNWKLLIAFHYVNFTSIKILFCKLIALRCDMRREYESDVVLFIKSPSVLLKICKSMCKHCFKFFKFLKIKHIQMWSFLLSLLPGKQKIRSNLLLGRVHLHTHTNTHPRQSTAWNTTSRRSGGRVLSRKICSRKPQ